MQEQNRAPFSVQRMVELPGVILKHCDRYPLLPPGVFHRVHTRVTCAGSRQIHSNRAVSTQPLKLARCFVVSTVDRPGKIANLMDLLIPIPWLCTHVLPIVSIPQRGMALYGQAMASSRAMMV